MFQIYFDYTVLLFSELVAWKICKSSLNTLIRSHGHLRYQNPNLNVHHLSLYTHIEHSIIRCYSVHFFLTFSVHPIIYFRYPFNPGRGVALAYHQPSYCPAHFGQQIIFNTAYILAITVAETVFSFRLLLHCLTAEIFISWAPSIFRQ
jgi:hypothetical protein